MNNLLQRLGGRKFLMALIVIGVGIFLEMRSPQGLTVTMASFLTGLVALFSAANYASTANHNKTKGGGNSDDERISEMHTMLKGGLGDPERLNALVGILGTLKTDMDQVKSISGETGKGMVNLLAKR